MEFIGVDLQIFNLKEKTFAHLHINKSSNHILKLNRMNYWKKYVFNLLIIVGL